MNEELNTPETEVPAEISAHESAADEPAAAASDEKQPEKPEKEPYTAADLLDDVLDLIETVICSIFVVLLLFTFVFCIAAVDGPSMEPTLLNEQRLVVSRLQRTYENGDILIIDCPETTVMMQDGSLIHGTGLGKRIVKRLIAQEGQVVNIDFANGIVYVDGQALDEPYTSAPTFNDNGALMYPFTVPEGYYFVLGDNRPISMDSRDPGVGLVHEESVVGKVVLRILPVSKFGKVE